MVSRAPVADRGKWAGYQPAPANNRPHRPTNTYIMQTQLLHDFPNVSPASNPTERVLVNEPLTEVGAPERWKSYRGSRGSASSEKGMQRYILFHSFCFIMYATLGRGFAYTGYSPIFIGEILLLWSIVTGFAARRFATLIERPLGLLLTCFFFWGIICTVPYVGLYGINAPRDGAVWAYSIFAWVVASLVLRLDNVLDGVVEHFRKFGGLLVVASTICAFLTTYEISHLPTWPTSQVPIPYMKSGDLCVHLAGCCAFVLTGLGKGKDWWLFPIICGFAMGISGNRGGGLAFMVAISFVALLRFNVKKLFILLVVLGLILSALVLVDVHVPLPSGSREISSEQILRNIKSMVGISSDEADLQGTKEWRIRWWNQIFDYTFQGPYFWTGKGYGINLAADDGIDGIARRTASSSQPSQFAPYISGEIRRSRLDALDHTPVLLGLDDALVLFPRESDRRHALVGDVSVAPRVLDGLHGQRSIRRRPGGAYDWHPVLDHIRSGLGGANSVSKASTA